MSRHELAPRPSLLERASKASALAGTVLALTAGAWEISHLRESNLARAERVALNRQDINKDPKFRATTVTITSGRISGSGSLVRGESGYELLTVEHVARPVFNLKTVAGKEIITTNLSFGGKDKKISNSMFVPGLGELEIPNDNPKPRLLGNNRPSNDYDLVDRAAFIPLDKSVQSRIAVAEAAGSLRTAEVKPFKAKFGDQFFMPLEETGKFMPFIYLDSRRESDKMPWLAPLVLFDKGLNYDRGMKFLRQKLSERIGVDVRHLNDLPDILLAASAHAIAHKQAAQMNLRDIDKANELANWLPCRGDSGSPLLDARGNIVAVISEVDYFKNKTVPSGVLSRRGDLDPNRKCGVEAKFTPIMP